MERLTTLVEDLVPQCTVAQIIAASQGRRGYGYP